MRRHSRAQQLNQDRIRKIRWRKRLKRKGLKYIPLNSGQDFLVEFPARFSLTNNYAETVKTIGQIKEIGHSRSRIPRRIKLDLSQTVEVSIAAVVVLCAEIDRIQAQNNRVRINRFFTSNLPSWNAEVGAQLDMFGFFKLLNVPLRANWPDELFKDRFAVVELIACNGFLPERVKLLTDDLQNVAEFFRQSPYVYEGLIEAVHNVVEHAYPDDWEFQFRPLDGTGWWAAASFEAAENEVRVVAFDQGVGIPETLPRWGLFEQVRQRLSEGSTVIGDLIRDDAHMINAAIQVSRSSRDRALGRGQGLAEIVSIVDEIPLSKVRILSARGGLLYRKGVDPSLFALDGHLGGTLIEWSIPVPNSMDQINDG